MPDPSQNTNGRPNRPKPAVLITLTRGADRLAQALLDQADIEIVNYHDVALPYLESRGIRCRRLWDFLPDGWRERVETEARRREAAIQTELGTDAAGGVLGSLVPDANLRERVQALLRRSAQRDLFPQMLLTDALRFCAAQTDLRLIVVHQDISHDTRTVIAAGHRLGIPSLHTLHGYPYGAEYAITLGGPMHAGVIAVFSQECKTFFEQLGVPPERIVVTGNFEWDPFARPVRPSYRSELCATMGLDPQRPIITYALTYSHAFSTISARHRDYQHRITEAVVAAFGELAQRHPDWQFVIRPHPNDADAPAGLAQQAEQAGAGKVLVDTASSSICCACVTDVLVCCQSNLGIEAILAGKPVVNCVIEDVAQPVFDEGTGRLFTEDDAVLNAHSAPQIAPAIEAALLDEAARRRFLERRPATMRRFNHLNDGKAVDRLTDLVFALMTPRHPRDAQDTHRPVLENALARAIPPASGKTLLLGSASKRVAAALANIRPEPATNALQAGDTFPDEDYDAVVLCDPLPHGPEAERQLRAAKKALAEGGALVACAIHGKASGPCNPSAGYSELGIARALSRCGLHVDRTTPVAALADGPADAWAIEAHHRGRRADAWGETRAARIRKAAGANAEGEALFAQGDLNGAAAAFARAVAASDLDGTGLFPQRALFYNNLATACHGLGKREDAWKNLLTALHFNPHLTSARGNLIAVGDALGRRNKAEAVLAVFGVEEPEATR